MLHLKLAGARPLSESSSKQFQVKLYIGNVSREGSPFWISPFYAPDVLLIIKLTSAGSTRAPIMHSLS